MFRISLNLFKQLKLSIVKILFWKFKKRLLLIVRLMIFFNKLIIHNLLVNSAINKIKINTKEYLKIMKMKYIKSSNQIFRSQLILFGVIQKNRLVQLNYRQILFIMKLFKVPLFSLNLRYKL